MSLNPNVAYGRALLDSVASVVPTFGNIHVVFSTSDTSDDRVNEMRNVFKPYGGQVRFHTSLETAYAAVTSNNNDVIALDADSSHTIANGIAWTKSRIHVIGLDSGGRLVQQGTKVQSTSGVGDAYVIKVTGTRNTFRNIKFIQADVTNTSLHVLEEGGEGSVYENCSFVFGVVDNLDLTTATEVLCGSDSATFKRCLFGTETLLTSAARAVFTIDQVTASQEFKSNILENCIWMISSSSATALMLKVAANTDVLFTNLFINPTFMASVDSAGGAALTNAAASVSGLVKGTLNFQNPNVFNCTNFMTTSDNAQVTGPVPTAATTGIGVTPA